MRLSRLDRNRLIDLVIVTVNIKHWRASTGILVLQSPWIGVLRFSLAQQTYSFTRSEFPGNSTDLALSLFQRSRSSNSTVNLIAMAYSVSPARTI